MSFFRNLIDSALDSIESTAIKIDRKVTHSLDNLEDKARKLDKALGFDEDCSIQDNKKHPKQKDKLQLGDVIGIHREAIIDYEHYGVYIGNNRVIHYTSPDSFINNRIMETDMSHFLKGQTEFFILDLEEVVEVKSSRPNKVYVTSTAAFCTPGDHTKLFGRKESWHLYSPQETVDRAKNAIGKKKYSLSMSNCEHFAIWCKTGVYKSFQVENIVGGTFKRNMHY